MRKRVFIVLIILFSISMTGQTEMLIGQISGRNIVRENFDEEGAFLNKQTFESGKVIDKNGYYEIEVITELFDKDKKSTDKYTTTYRCKPNEASVMVMAFPFSNPKSKETEINTTSKNFKELYDLNNLENIELEMSFDSGLLNFFGSKSTIKIYDRKVDGNKSNIKSKINIKAYAWGIRIKQLNYRVQEELNDNGLLTFQKFTEADGSYFKINYK
ncbi:hypothetical protein LCGC14_0281150 [marine sediment metagenome]|uniref:Uncharacterized protein n=1 Tax=marine sediment metagenome TaxID=412755 RepID=A0A0F9UD69_9ZZZZ|nr:hypothetical protein [Maribacter sp.]HDZ05792.1 hypothetical protein [Maribacter sp.]|tara:strand:- start:301 stop:945 length:645 start_codon:yes stop_codon:yes gene_type:complete